MPARWEVGNVSVRVRSYEGSVPGPTLRVRAGDEKFLAPFQLARGDFVAVWARHETEPAEHSAHYERLNHRFTPVVHP